MIGYHRTAIRLRKKETHMKRFTLALALIAPALFAAPPPQNPDETLVAAKAAIRQNDGERAAEMLEKAVAARPNSAELHYWLGQAYGSIGETAGGFKQMSMGRKAMAEIERAVE